MVKVRGPGGSAPLLRFEPPAIVWAPLIESIKCYFRQRQISGVWNGYGVCSNLASSGEPPPPVSHDHINHCPLHRPSLVNIDTRDFEFIMVTDPQTNKQTNPQANKLTHTQTDRAELSVGLFSSTQPNPTHQITDPTQPTARWTYGPMTQPNPYPTEPPYIEQQLACRKEISL